MMADLIDRQTALREIHKQVWLADTAKIALEEKLSALPSAQPDVPDTNVGNNDLISRQAAYEALTDYYHHRTDIQHMALHEALNKVPSAERVAHWEKGRCSRCHAHAPFWMMASTYYLSNYCPNCGALMDEVAQ